MNFIDFVIDFTFVKFCKILWCHLQSKLYLFFTSENIVGIAPSDFDGDGDMDLLVSTLSSTKTIISQVYFGDRETLTKCKIFIFIFLLLYFYSDKIKYYYNQ